MDSQHPNASGAVKKHQISYDQQLTKKHKGLSSFFLIQKNLLSTEQGSN